MAEIDRFFHYMAKKNLHSLHLVAGMKPIGRIANDLEPVSEKVLSDAILRKLLFEILTPEQVEEFERKMDLDFAYELEGVARFRINYFFQHRGVGAVFRKIPTQVLSFEDLGLPPAIKKFTSLTMGLVLVTGPTGSGKSTTLAALIDYINTTRSEHIITVEDPIEFVHESKKCLVNHRQVGLHTESFSLALRAALREDPDVIMVGEMRDLETIELAIRAAETGHLVFGTLHTSSAPKTVDRIIDAFPHDQQEQIRTMLSESLKGVITQQLIKRKDLAGRVPAIEVLIITGAVSNLIREGKTYQIFSSMQTGKQEGMQLMDDSIMSLFKDGLITAEEAHLRAVDKKNFEGLLTKDRQGIAAHEAGTTYNK